MCVVQSKPKTLALLIILLQSTGNPKTTWKNHKVVLLSMKNSYFHTTFFYLKYYNQLTY